MLERQTANVEGTIHILPGDSVAECSDVRVFAIDIDTLLRLVSVSIIYLYLFAPSKYRHLYVDLSGFIEYSPKNHYLCLANLMLSITCNAIPLEIIMRIEKFFCYQFVTFEFQSNSKHNDNNMCINKITIK